MTNKKLKLAAMSVALTACSILRAPYTYSRSRYECTPCGRSNPDKTACCGHADRPHGAPHTAKAAPQAGTSGACGAAFCFYETEENAQRSAPLERMTF